VDLAMTLSLTMHWPVTGDPTEATFTAAAGDVDHYAREHGLVIQHGHYTAVPADRTIGHYGWLLHFTGTAVAAPAEAVQDPLPVEPLDPMAQFLVAQALGRTTGFTFAYTRDGWQIDPSGDDPFLGIPMADDDEIAAPRRELVSA
jgi:hypothetical protein